MIIDITTKLQAGAEIDFEDPAWIPTGTAEAVFYLGERVAGDVMVPLGDGSEAQKVWSKVVLRESQQKQALRYLRPCSAEWHEDNPGRHGLTCCPDLRGAVRFYPRDLVKLAKAEQVRVDHQICTQSKLAEDPWLITTQGVRWVQAEAGIWCVFYAEVAG